MPRYDYKCIRCGKKEERIVPIKEMNVQGCECGEYMNIQISSPPALNGFNKFGQSVGRKLR